MSGRYGGMAEESVAQFMRRRVRERSTFGGEAEAAAYEASRRAIRLGQDLRLPTPEDVRQYGAAVLRQRATVTASKANNAPKLRGPSASVSAGGVQAARKVLPRSRAFVATNPVARKLAGDTAEFAGNVVGAGRGALHAGEGLWDAAVFSGRMIGGDRDTWDQVGSAAMEAFKYGARAAAEPGKVVRDVQAKARRMRTELDPQATPEAPTFGAEMSRRFDIGQNQGELALNAASVVLGGPAAKAVGRLSTAVRASPASKYLAQGFSPEAAARLAEPYMRKGHHYVGERVKLPISRTYRDGAYNLLAPKGITIGDMYELHAKVDPHFWGAKLIPGQPWRAKAVGVEKYDAAGRLWHGAPGPLKARVGGLGATAGGFSHHVSEEGEEERW